MHGKNRYEIIGKLRQIVVDEISSNKPTNHFPAYWIIAAMHLVYGRGLVSKAVTQASSNGMLVYS